MIQETDPNLAEIAAMLIQRSFQHLETKGRENLTLSHERTMKEAVDLSNYLLSLIKGTPYYHPIDLGRP